jgi:hypothetical protein
MQRRRVRGRRYSDPDLISLIDSGDDVDPYEFVGAKAGELLRLFDSFPGDFSSALERITALASLAGYQVKALEPVRSAKHDRDGVIVPTQDAKKRGVILYDPTKTETRIVHSIAHEIVHSFFPNSHAGAHFRSVHRIGGPVPELEMLCDFGAAILTMPPAAFVRTLKSAGISLAAVDAVRRQFGTSFTATLYRMACTAGTAVAAGLFCYRSTKAEDLIARQGTLFPQKAKRSTGPKYRRQSFHHSPSFPAQLIFPWNKSLPHESAAYEAARTGAIIAATEVLQPKANVRATFRVEAISAPYQPPDADGEWPDVLVLLTLLQ